MPFRVGPDGQTVEMTFFPDGTGAFRHEYARIGNIGDTRPRKNEDRERLLERLRQPLDNPSPLDRILRAGDHIRASQFAEAQALLGPLVRARAPDFRAVANLAHLYAAQGEWADALRYHELALELDFPTDMPNVSPAQRDWLRRVERDYYHRWLKLHVEEARRRTRPQEEDLFPLFGESPPPDAIAIVQQLLLWHPSDNRLYWLLGELYARSNRPRQALLIFDSLASEDRQQSNRVRMMERRAELKRIVEALPREAEPDFEIAAEPPDTRPLHERLGLDLTRFAIIVGVFALIAVPLLLLQVRKIVRVLRRRPS